MEERTVVGNREMEVSEAAGKGVIWADDRAELEKKVGVTKEAVLSEMAEQTAEE